MKHFFIALVAAAILSPLPVSSAVVGDINQDGKIDLMESIYALQVASGVYPTIEDSCLLTGKGGWESGINYNLCDVVTFSEITYACAVAHTSATGSIEPSNTSYWTVLSIKGEVGPPGAAAAGQVCLDDGYVSGFDANGDIICHYPSKYVFVTAGTHNGDLGGVAGADSICQDEADAIFLRGTYKAWISDNTSQPSDTFTKNNGKYILLDGTIIADNWIDFTDGTLQHPINMSSTQTAINQYSWTNTLPSGQRAISGNETFFCNEWTSNGSAPIQAIYGTNSSSSSEWTYTDAHGCNFFVHLYCIEQ